MKQFPLKNEASPTKHKKAIDIRIHYRPFNYELKAYLAWI